MSHWRRLDVAAAAAVDVDVSSSSCRRARFDDADAGVASCDDLVNSVLSHKCLHLLYAAAAAVAVGVDSVCSDARSTVQLSSDWFSAVLVV